MTNNGIDLTIRLEIVPMNGPKEMLPSEQNADRGSGKPLEFDSSLNASFKVNEFGETVSYLSPTDSTSDTGPAAAEFKLPTSIGRYEIRGVLGRGHYGHQ